MAMMEFEFTFPSYALASDYNTNPVTGIIELDSSIQFVAPNMPEEQQLAIFTDRHLAEEYLKVSSSTADLIAFATEPDLLTFLHQVKHRFRCIVVDLNPKTGIGRSLVIRSLLGVP